MVVLFLDRLGRNPREIFRRYWELQERGITVQSVHENLREELLLLVRAGIAGQDSKRTSERVRMAIREAVLRGTLVGSIPFGYAKVRDREGDGKHTEQVPGQVCVIRLAYELATVENLGYKRIADALNSQGCRTKSGKFFMSETVKVILTNPALVGRMVFKGSGEPVVTEDAYPAILSAEEWDTLQRRLAIRREERHRGRTDSSVYLLSGIARCGHCGGPMSGSYPGNRPYYLCKYHKKAEARCGERNPHLKDALEDAILEHLGQYVDPERVLALLEAQGQETHKRDEFELCRVAARLGELEQGFLNDLDRVDRGIMTEPEYLKRQEVRRKEQEGLESRKVELAASVVAQRDMEAQAVAVPVKVRSFIEDFRDMDVRQAKAILQGIVKAAHVFNDGRIELEFR